MIPPRCYFLVLIAIIAVAPIVTQADDRIDALVLEGETYLLRDMLEFAAERFNEILEIDSQNATAVAGLKKVNLIRRANSDYVYERILAEGIMEISGSDHPELNPHLLMPLEETLSSSQKKRILVAYKNLLIKKARILESNE